MFLKALPSKCMIHQPSMEPSITQLVLNNAEYWLTGCCAMLPEFAACRRGRPRSAHVYTSIYLMKWLAQAALDEHLLLSLHESIEQRVNLGGGVFSQIKTFTLWWQTDPFQALLKHSADRPAGHRVCSDSVWTSAAPRHRTNLEGALSGPFKQKQWQGYKSPYVGLDSIVRPDKAYLANCCFRDFGLLSQTQAVFSRHDLVWLADYIHFLHQNGLLLERSWKWD